MGKSVLALAGLILSSYALSAQQPPKRTAPIYKPNAESESAASVNRSLLNSYCVTCHNEKLGTAGLMLDKMDPAAVAQNAPAWEKVVHKLRTGAMPPAGRPRPAKNGYRSLVGYLEAELDRADA